jgi:hypothetical protein
VRASITSLRGETLLKESHRAPILILTYRWTREAGTGWHLCEDQILPLSFQSKSNDLIRMGKGQALVRINPRADLCVLAEPPQNRASKGLCRRRLRYQPHQTRRS